MCGDLALQDPCRRRTDRIRHVWVRVDLKLCPAGLQVAGVIEKAPRCFRLAEHVVGHTRRSRHDGDTAVGADQRGDGQPIEFGEAAGAARLQG